MDGNGQGGTEVRLKTVAELFFPCAKVVGESVDTMSKLYHNMITAFIMSYANAYHNADGAGNEATFDNKSFRKMSADIIAEKKVEERMLQRLAERASSMTVG